MEITEKELIEKLETIAKEDNLLKTDVCEYLLDQEKDCILSHWKDVLQYGCSGGLVRHLIYHTDTYAFFDKYYDEIEELRIEAEEDTGQPLDLQGNLKNTLAWFGFEETAYRLAAELKLEI